MRKYIEENLDEIKNDLKELVSINSEYSNDELPFGSNNKKVLDKALVMMQEKGFKPCNLDYYCGYGEVGEGDKTIGVVAHLDVVPVGDGWATDPFVMCEKDGVLYGRGVADDKGAAVASMWAIKYLLDTGYKFKKKVRLILGCNEETGSECVKHYVEKCGDVDLGFTPDGDFPGIYAEKGMISGILVGRESKIIDIKSEGATNIVSKKCMVKVPGGSLNVEKLDKFFKDVNINYEFGDNVLTVYGKAAHASVPEDGVNAINYAMAGLYNADFNDTFVDFFMKNFGLTYHGELIGYEDLKDEATNTSINFGLAAKENEEVRISLDMRFPIKQDKETCVKPLNNLKDEFNKFVLRGSINPLYFDINSPFIKALEKAYKDVTGDNEAKMQAIGGGTYAKSMKNIIAFGCAFLDEQNHLHEDNECLKVESLIRQIEIYVEAIKNLNEVE